MDTSLRPIVESRNSGNGTLEEPNQDRTTRASTVASHGRSAGKQESITVTNVSDTEKSVSVTNHSALSEILSVSSVGFYPSKKIKKTEAVKEFWCWKLDDLDCNWLEDEGAHCSRTKEFCQFPTYCSLRAGLLNASSNHPFLQVCTKKLKILHVFCSLTFLHYLSQVLNRYYIRVTEKCCLFLWPV